MPARYTKTRIDTAYLPRLRRLASVDGITLTDMLGRAIDEALTSRNMPAELVVEDELAAGCDALMPRVRSDLVRDKCLACELPLRPTLNTHVPGKCDCYYPFVDESDIRP